MPLDKYALILVIVIAAAGATVWIGTLVAAAVQFPVGWLVLIPVALVGYLLWRVLSDRISNTEDDHYDRIEK